MSKANRLHKGKQALRLSRWRWTKTSTPNRVEIKLINRLDALNGVTVKVRNKGIPTTERTCEVFKTAWVTVRPFGIELKLVDRDTIVIR